MTRKRDVGMLSSSCHLGRRGRGGDVGPQLRRGRRQAAVGAGWHPNLCREAKAACSDGPLDEARMQAISSIVLTSELSPWLTAQQAQGELVAEVLAKHRGPSAGKKPSVRETAGRARSDGDVAPPVATGSPPSGGRDRLREEL